MNHIFKTFLLSFFALLLPALFFAQTPSIESTFDDTFDIVRYIMIGFVIFLLIIIVVLVKVVLALSQVKREKIRKQNNKRAIIPVITIFLIGMINTVSSFAQDLNEIKEPTFSKQFITLPADIIVLSIMIIFELIIILQLARIQSTLISSKKVITEKTTTTFQEKWNKFFTKMNNTVSIDEEDKLDLQHDYDGIRELDNKIPSWWLYSFYGTILIGVIYMYRMFISETMPDQITELHEENRLAQIKIQEYLKNAANNVDENSVVMLDDAGIASGQKLFKSMGCITCHGENGEGNSVGPNLTDDYWLHKGSINDIFYSIKYGWPEKGMKSWKDDLSPIQIAQIASYIKSLKGSNPPNAREPQGDIYVDENTTDETTSTDSDQLANSTI